MEPSEFFYRAKGDGSTVRAEPFIQLGDLFLQIDAIIAVDFEAKDAAVLLLHSAQESTQEMTFYRDTPEYHALLQWLTSQSRVLLGGKHASLTDKETL